MPANSDSPELPGLASPFARLSFAERSDLFDEERTDMARMFSLISYDYPCSPRRNEDKVRMRHAQALAAVGADLIRSEWNRPIELTNRFDQLAYKVKTRSRHWQAPLAGQELMPSLSRFDFQFKVVECVDRQGEAVQKRLDRL